MRLQHISTAGLVLSLVGAVVAATTTPPPPAVVTAVAMGDATLVAWTPVPGAQSYIVFGVLGTDLIKVATSNDTSVMVNGVYDTFAVASVMDGAQSDPQYVTAGTCVQVYTGVPPSAQLTDCGATSTGPLHIELKLP